MEERLEKEEINRHKDSMKKLKEIIDELKKEINLKDISINAKGIALKEKDEQSKQLEARIDTLETNEKKRKSFEVENKSLKKEIDTLKKLQVEKEIGDKKKDENIRLDKKEITNRDETIKHLEKRVEELTTSNRDFDRFKYLYVKANRDLKENTEIKDKEIKALRITKTKIHDEHDSGEHTCHICDFRSISKGGLKIHVTVKHRLNNEVKCKKCEQTFESILELRNHDEYEHELDLVCEYCEFKCDEVQTLLCHEGSQHGIQCEQWDCKFNCKGTKHNPNDLKKLVDHVKSEHGFKCDSCDEGFKNKTKLNDHIKDDHSDDDTE